MEGPDTVKEMMEDAGRQQNSEMIVADTHDVVEGLDAARKKM